MTLAPATTTLATRERTVRTTIGLIILTIMTVVPALVDTWATVGHFLREDWPPHAKFHLFNGLGGLLGADGLILLLAWGPLRRGERWAWFGVAFAMLTVMAGFLTGASLTEGGLASQQGVVAGGAQLMRGAAVVFTASVAGLVLAWPRAGSRTPH